MPAVDKLILELGSAGLLVDEEAYYAFRTNAVSIGRLDKGWLEDSLGDHFPKNLLKKYGSSQVEDGFALALGQSHLLTLSLQSCYRVDSQIAITLGRLGALTQVIVGLFDGVIDNGVSRDDILGESQLQLLIASPTGWKALLSSRQFLTSEALEMAALVHLYFETLRSLRESSLNDLLYKRILFYILLMYKEEKATLSGCSEATLVRKSVLPFIVMGLPVLLLSNRNHSYDEWKFFRLLHRIGIYVGMVDDLMDLDQDSRTSHPNLVSHRLMAGTTLDQILLEIARSGQSIRHSLDENFVFDAQSSVSSIIISWLGGSYVHKVVAANNR